MEECVYFIKQGTYALIPAAYNSPLFTQVCFIIFMLGQSIIAGVYLVKLELFWIIHVYKELVNVRNS